MKELLIILVSSAIVHNVVLSQFLGLCPFFGVSKKTETAVGMGGALVFVITLSSFVTGLIYNYPCSFRHGIFTDNRIYPDHCSTGSVCRNVS